MEDKDDRQHFSLKGIMDSEKKMNKKRRKRKEKEEEIVEDDFNVDLKDSRFDALFTSHHFAVDPSDPQYRCVLWFIKHGRFGAEKILVRSSQATCVL